MVVTKRGPEGTGVVVEVGIENMRVPTDGRRHHQDDGTTLSATCAELTDAKDTAAGLNPENVL
jgi:hypothetical protein